MKVKELIAELQRLDPTGELYVDGVQFIDRLAGYWDGPCLRIEGNIAEFNDVDDKIRIYSMDMLELVEAGMVIKVNIRSPQRREWIEGEIKRNTELYEQIVAEVASKMENKS